MVSALAVAALGELVVFAGWAASGGHPGPIAVYPLIASSATAMGAQSAAVRSLADVNTTYLTGTMTALIVDTETGRESEASAVRRVSVIVAFVAAAALAALLLRHALIAGSTGSRSSDWRRGRCGARLGGSPPPSRVFLPLVWTLAGLLSAHAPTRPVRQLRGLRLAL